MCVCVRVHVCVCLCMYMCVLLCMQCSFEAGELAVAESAGQILWHHFTEEEGEEGEREGPKSIHYGVQ